MKNDSIISVGALTIETNFLLVPSYVVALSMVGLVAIALVIGVVVYCTTRTKRKERFTRSESLIRETEELREESVVIISDTQLDSLHIANYSKPRPSPSIFSRGEDFLTEVLHSVNNASDFSSVNFDTSEFDKKGSISNVSKAETIHDVTSQPEDLLFRKNVSLTTTKESPEMAIFLESIETPIALERESLYEQEVLRSSNEWNCTDLGLCVKQYSNKEASTLALRGSFNSEDCVSVYEEVDLVCQDLNLSDEDLDQNNKNDLNNPQIKLSEFSNTDGDIYSNIVSDDGADACLDNFSFNSGFIMTDEIIPENHDLSFNAIRQSSMLSERKNTNSNYLFTSEGGNCSFQQPGPSSSYAPSTCESIENAKQTDDLSISDYFKLSPLPVKIISPTSQIDSITNSPMPNSHSTPASLLPNPNGNIVLGSSFKDSLSKKSPPVSGIGITLHTSSKLPVTPMSGESTVYSPVYNLRFGSAGGMRLTASAPVSDEVDNGVENSEGSNDDVHQISIGNEFETPLDEDAIFPGDSVEFILQ